ncbi:MAG TPA: hypothetical protein VFC77_13235 [Myxococcota bacterium]|nr:hypothetical protein [Myxococcota bacterium]
MSDSQEPQAEPLSLEETARAAAELATRAEAPRLAAAFLELVQRWAAPSAVLTAVRDPAGVAGFRLVPSLCNGSISLGIEKTLAKLVEETPQCLARPTLVRGEEMPGVRVRDNVVVPWWCEADSGLLVLRGVPRPVRPGLGEALVLTAAVVWPRLLGSPASRVEALVQELQAAAARLESESGRQLDRLKVAAAAAAPGPAAESTDAPRIAELEETIAKQRQEREAQSRALEDRARVLEETSTKLRERESQARELEGTIAKLRNEREAQPRELEDTIAKLRQEGEGRARELEAARREKETASLDLAAAKQQSENAKRELAAALEERRTAERDLDVARRELAARMATPPAAPAPPPEPPAETGGAKPPGGERGAEALKLAIASVRRAAFVPPMLRVSMEEVASLAAAEPRPARRHGIALLDRDVVALESVATELEQAGVEVRLANQPEEMALLLRVDASSIDAVVCDVMSFRPDQNVAGLLRSWDKDRPGLAFFLSYDAQSPVELERARRTPMSLTAGHIQRPLTGARLGETLENLSAKRQPKTS